MCDMIPDAEHWRVPLATAQTLQHDIMGYLPGLATQRIVCDVPYVGKRWVHQVAEDDRERGIGYWTKNYLTRHRAGRRGGTGPPVHLLRTDPHPACQRPGVWAQREHDPVAAELRAASAGAASAADLLS